MLNVVDWSGNVRIEVIDNFGRKIFNGMVKSRNYVMRFEWLGGKEVEIFSVDNYFKNFDFEGEEMGL